MKITSNFMNGQNNPTVYEYQVLSCTSTGTARQLFLILLYLEEKEF